MTAKERGFLLLTSHLGDPNRKPLTLAQRRNLARRVMGMDRPREDRELREEDLISLGYSRSDAAAIAALFSQEDLLDYYIRKGKRLGCMPITCVSPNYPAAVREKLELECPGCYWAKGDLAILELPAVSLVGSRELQEENRRFAEKVGTEAAKNGLVLVSGNARGADRAAQDACLAAGGKVISVLADELTSYVPHPNQLLLSEEDFNAPFSTQRALNRNRSIHALGQAVFVAQSDLGRGGTWAGTVKNLNCGWTPVMCFRDGSESSQRLAELGAGLIGIEELDGIQNLK